MSFFLFSNVFSLTITEFKNLNDVVKQLETMFSETITDVQSESSACADYLIGEYGNTLLPLINTYLTNASPSESKKLHSLCYLIIRLDYEGLLDNYTKNYFVGLFQKKEIDYILENKCIDYTIVLLENYICMITDEQYIKPSFLNSGLELKQTFETLLGIEVEIKAPFYETNPW